jgi:hypothetical protein
MGCSFGTCEECTPKEYFDLESKLRQLYNDATLIWDAQIDEKRRSFIDDYVRENQGGWIKAKMAELEKAATGRIRRNK